MRRAIFAVVCLFVAGAAFGGICIPIKPTDCQPTTSVQSSSFTSQFINLVDQGEARFRVWARVWREQMKEGIPQARPIKRVVTPSSICIVIKPTDCQPPPNQ